MRSAVVFVWSCVAEFAILSVPVAGLAKEQRPLDAVVSRHTVIHPLSPASNRIYGLS